MSKPHLYCGKNDLQCIHSTQRNGIGKYVCRVCKKVWVVVLKRGKPMVSEMVGVTA